MNRLTLSFLILLLLTACQKPTVEGEITHYVEELEPIEVADSLAFTSLGLSAAVDPIAGIAAAEKIVNTGEKLWNIVEKNRASTHATVTFANAIPKGIAEGTELEGFSDLQLRSYRAYGKNLYGVTVYDVEYTLMHRYGGNLNGVGRYLDHVAVVPNNITALWGYTVYMSVAASAPTNLGTTSRPIAAMVVQVKLSVATVLKSVQATRTFEFRGDDSRVTEPKVSSALATR